MPVQQLVKEEASAAARATSAWRRFAARGVGRRPLPPAEDKALTSTDPLALFRALERSDRFRRDTRLGGIFHTGKISFRELTPTDSLHIVIDGSRVSAHVDEISPLDFCEDGTVRYSLGRVLAHNLSVARGDVLRRLQGTHGRQRCNMACEVVWVDDDEAIAEVVGESCDDPCGGGHATHDHATHDHDDHDHDAHDLATETVQVPFSLVDEAVHLLDTEAAPWSVQLEARVAGRLDEPRLRAAITTALAAHPMARARKMPSRPSLHHDRWEIRPDVDLDPLRVVDCPDDAALAVVRADLLSTGVPLAESPPLRARLARHPDGDLLMLNVNHAAMDGFGARRVLLSVARAYAGDPDPAPEVDFLESRDLPVRLADAAVATRVRRWLALAERLRGLVVPPARLAGEGGSDHGGYGFHHLSLTPAQTAGLGDLNDGRATRGCTDVLATALSLAIAGWNAEHGRRCGRIGVLLPNNLRPPAWGDDMVGNFSLPARVSTTAHDRRTPRAALDALAAQTRRKRQAGMGTAVIEVLGRSSLFPLWAKQTLVTLLPLTGNRLVDTAMVCDLGRLREPLSFGPEVGDAVELWFSPPARMPLGMAVGAAASGDRLHLSFRYRRGLLGVEAAGRFVDRFRSELDALLGTAASPAPMPPRP